MGTVVHCRIRGVLAGYEAGFSLDPPKFRRDGRVVTYECPCDLGEWDF